MFPAAKNDTVSLADAPGNPTPPAAQVAAEAESRLWPAQRRTTGTAVTFTACLASLAFLAALLSGIPSPASERHVLLEAGQSGSDRPTVVINGRGWGHGRGMSQYGAHGYATNFGWSSSQILDHYYGGTSSGQAPQPGAVDPDRVRVDLVSMRGRAAAVSLSDGTLHLMASDGSTLSRVTGAVRLTSNGGTVELATASDCSGPWTVQPTIDHSLVRIAADSTADGQSGLLELCGPSYRTWYDGELWTTSSGGSQRTLNLVSVEQYLRGVVPNEMPASWDSRALESQAVAARSYALAGDTRWSGYADTCDTTTCQVYDGRFTTRGSGFRLSTHPNTDAAISATAGVVRLETNGEVARTEFSSSTGGYTAGGDFPAVIDEGDSVSINPNHQWQATIDLQSIEDANNKGRLTGMSISESNGLGPDGGRAITVTYHFANGEVTANADTVRRKFGLKSNWFSVASFSRGGVVIPSVAPNDIATFVDRAYQRLGGRAPTAEEAARWNDELRSGSRITLAQDLVRSDHFAGVLVDDLYIAALGRSADGDGRTYWVATMADGLKYEHLGTLFYGSPEYVRRSGGSNQTFLTSLYVNILGRQPDAAGFAYWLDLLDSGAATSADVANAFYRSIESRRDRARSLHRRVIGSEPTSQDAEVGAERLLSVDDLTLAAEYAASPQFVGAS